MLNIFHFFKGITFLKYFRTVLFPGLNWCMENTLCSLLLLHKFYRAEPDYYTSSHFIFLFLYIFQVGTSLGARRGLLLRGGNILEKFSMVNSIVFDKTGTLTIGRPVVTKVVTPRCVRNKI